MTRAAGSPAIQDLWRPLRARALADAADDDLLALFVARRDEAAFEALLRRHGPMVWGVCRRLLVHRQDAEDAFQATFLVLGRKAASVRRRGPLTNWLFGVARRAALNARTRRARRARREQAWGDLPETPVAPEAPRDDVAAALDEELARLPEKYRLPLLLCGLEGLTHAEAGRRLGWPTGTVAGRLSRARELLRARLVRRGVGASLAGLTAPLAGGAAGGASAAAVPPLLAASARAAVAAGTSAAVVPAPVAALVQGVLRKMVLARLWAAATLVPALALALGVAGAVRHATSPGILPGNAARAREEAAAAAPPGAPGRALPPAGPGRRGKPALRLPADPAAVVLRWERFVEPRTSPGTVVTIRAGGRLTVEVPDADPEGPGSQVLEGELPAPKLLELLRFALHDQEFFDFDPAEVKAALLRAKAPTPLHARYQASGKLGSPADAPTTRLRIRTAGRDHEVRWDELGNARYLFPEVKRLRQLAAVDRQLQHLLAVQLAGGPGRVEEVVSQMQDLVRPIYRRYPDVPRLTAGDLVGVAPLADGSGARLSFAPPSAARCAFSVTLNVPREGPPTLDSFTPPQ